MINSIIDTFNYYTCNVTPQSITSLHSLIFEPVMSTATQTEATNEQSLRGIEKQLEEHDKTLERSIHTGICNSQAWNVLRQKEESYLKNLLPEFFTDINKQDIYGNCLLHYALQYNLDYMSGILLNMDDVNPNILNKSGQSPLSEYLNRVKLHSDNGRFTRIICRFLGNEKTTFTKENAYLILSLSNNYSSNSRRMYTHIVHNLLEKHYELETALKMKDSNGKTSLHHAVDNFNSEAVEYLTSRGASPSEQDNNCHTPFYYLTTKDPKEEEEEKAYSDILTTLCRRSTDPKKNLDDFVERVGQNLSEPIFKAIVNSVLEIGHVQTLEGLCTRYKTFFNNASSAFLKRGAAEQNYEAVKSLLKMGADPNSAEVKIFASYASGKTYESIPFYSAYREIYRNNLDILKLLLERDAIPYKEALFTLGENGSFELFEKTFSKIEESEQQNILMEIFIEAFRQFLSKKDVSELSVLMEGEENNKHLIFVKYLITNHNINPKEIRTVLKNNPDFTDDFLLESLEMISPPCKGAHG